MWDHSVERMTWKCRHLTVHCLPSVPEICEHFHCIWIQTELNSCHYTASCVIATTFLSVCSFLFELPTVSAVFTHLLRVVMTIRLVNWWCKMASCQKKCSQTEAVTSFLMFQLKPFFFFSCFFFLKVPYQYV